LALRLKLFGNAKRKSFLAVSTPLANKEEPEDPCQAGGRRTLVSKSGSTGLVGWLAGWQDGWCESQHLSQHNALTNTLLASLSLSLRHDTGRKMSGGLDGMEWPEMSWW